MKVPIIIFLLLFSLIGFNFSQVYGSIFNSESRTSEYIAPKYKSKFYDKHGLVNVDKAFRNRRIDPSMQRKMITAKNERITLRDDDLTSPFRSVFYKKNGLVNNGRSVTNRRPSESEQLAFVPTRNRGYESRTASSTQIRWFHFNFGELSLFKSKPETEIKQEIVSPR